MGIQDLERIESKIDRAEAGAIAVNDAAGGVLFQRMADLMEFAKLMSVSKQAVPQHCRGEPGVCLAICVQATEWRFSPFAVANKSYVVNDRVTYESQLVHAVVEARAPLQGRLRCQYEGEGTEMRCTVTGLLDGEKEPHEYTSPRIKDIKTKNSPLWTSDPQQQLFYFASRSWARKWVPDVLLGIYTVDELEEDSVRDITPKPEGLKERLGKRKGARGFSEDGVTKALEHKSGEAAPAEPLQSQPEPETVATATEVNQPAEETQSQTVESPLARGHRLLASCKKKSDVADLRATIAEELSGDDLQTWNQTCDGHVAGLKG